MIFVKGLRKFICLCVRKNYPWLEIFRFFKIHYCIGDDNNYIAYLNLTGCCTIQTYTTTAALTFDNICLKSLAVNADGHL